MTCNFGFLRDKEVSVMPKAVLFAAAIFALILTPSVAQAIPFAISGDGALGDFTGIFDYNAGTQTVSVSLTNTSLAANGGFITAFAFNIPTGGDVTSVVYDASAAFPAFDDQASDLLGQATFDNTVNGSPFGLFDIGATTRQGFQGGGTPVGGIGVGQTATFSFVLTGTGLGALTTLDFLNALSSPPGAGGGLEEFVVRFRGFEDGGSDKVPVDTKTPITETPEPTTTLLLGFAMTSLAISGIRRSRRKS